MTKKPLIGRGRDLAFVSTSQIIKNERNPRHKASFTKEELASLRVSIAQHGVLQPLLAQRYDDDMYLLIEGERRWTVAKELGIKELPVIVSDRLDEHDQLVTMYNVHTQRKGWEMAEELTAIKELLEKNGNKNESELATELGMSIGTLRDRFEVLGMGPQVVSDIARGNLDYSSALRANQVAKTVARKRPDVAERLGGAASIEKKLLDKARKRPRGISQELVAARRDLADPTALSDALVEEYLADPKAELREIRRRTGDLEARRKVESLGKELGHAEREINTFNMDLETVPNLRELRIALASLINSAQRLESRVTTVLLEKEASEP